MTRLGFSLPSERVTLLLSIPTVNDAILHVLPPYYDNSNSIFLEKNCTVFVRIVGPVHPLMVPEYFPTNEKSHAREEVSYIGWVFLGT